jgi:SAM-dependent methyltransferase
VSAAGTDSNPYDELPYVSQPIEWTAPERLAMVSLLHGGPRAPLDGYRVLELGCGDGANLVPLAYYRRQAQFVGVDGSGHAIAAAAARKQELGLGNLELVHSDFLAAADRISGTFDYIIAHGVLSWVPEPVRQALLALVAARLRPRGLAYVNYNVRPGWNVRGMVRDYLLAQTARVAGLGRRANQAKEAAGKMAASLAAAEHPYTQLMANEFRFVADGHVSYVAHEFLSPVNDAFWHSELTALVARHGLKEVAEADYNLPSGRISDGMAEQIVAAELVGQSLDDTVDLLSFRQHRTPIFTHASWVRSDPGNDELANLLVASCLAPLPRQDQNGVEGVDGVEGKVDDGAVPTFRHPSGAEVETRKEVTRAALERLHPIWPRSLPVRDLFGDAKSVIEDIVLLHRHGMIDLRLVEPADFDPPQRVLREHERRWGYFTTPYHTREAVAPR